MEGHIIHCAFGIVGQLDLLALGLAREFDAVTLGVLPQGQAFFVVRVRTCAIFNCISSDLAALGLILVTVP